MDRRPNLWRALRIDFALVGLIAITLTSWFILRDPYFTPAAEVRAEGSRPPDRTEGDVLLLLPDTPAAEAKNLDELDCSYGWFNALWQHYGSFASAMTRTLSPEILAGRSVVIVPWRVAESMPSAGISALAGFVRDGGQLVLERPGDGWERLSGVSPNEKTLKAQRITSTEGLGAHGPLRKHLPNVPLVGQLELTPRQEPFPSGPVLMEVDGHPGALARPYGQGYVYTLLFDFSCTVTGLQQGIPVEGMRFRARERVEGLAPTSSRVTDERLKTSKVPYADLLERALFQRFSVQRPLPRLWSFPGTSAGALVFTHATPDDTRAALGYADFGRKREGSATVFAAADRLNATQAALLADSRADIATLWVHGEQRAPITRSVGIGALQPLRQELSLTEQHELLLEELPSKIDEPRVVRTEGSLWELDWSTTFEHLNHAGFKLDSSFGPSTDEQSGYMFGTGFPFYPLDRRGLPMPLMEAPYVLHEGSLTRDRLRSFLGNSQAYFHQSLTVSLPAHTMRTSPTAGALLALRDAHELAKQHEHWVASLEEVLAFLSARRKSVLTSQWSEMTRRLTISVNLLGSPSRTIDGGVFPGVAFPRTWQGEDVDRVVLDGTPYPTRKLRTTGSSLDYLIDVGPGRHTLSVYYKLPQQEGALSDEQ